MAVFPPVSGEEGDRSVGGDMLEDGNQCGSGGIHTLCCGANERGGLRLASLVY